MNEDGDERERGEHAVKREEKKMLREGSENFQAIDKGERGWRCDKSNDNGKRGRRVVLEKERRKKMIVKENKMC